MPISATVLCLGPKKEKIGLSQKPLGLPQKLALRGGAEAEGAVPEVCGSVGVCISVCVSV